MEPIEITRLDDPRISPFVGLTEAQLRNRLHPEQALFIAESPKVINVAIDRGLQPKAMLCEKRHIDGDAASIIARCPQMQVFTGSRELLASLTGYILTRGVLCAFPRPASPPLAAVIGRGEPSESRDTNHGSRESAECAVKSRVVVIDSVSDTTNIGAIFRSAAALGIDAVLLTPTSCDPLNRRSVRVSMGSVFLVPWTWIDDINTLRNYGYKTVAMALTDKSVSIDDPALNAEPRLAIVMGTEGDGLPHSTIAEADYTARIPMANNVDSLNVAAAAALAFWQLRK